jgi:hypothetical protein
MKIRSKVRGTPQRSMQRRHFATLLNAQMQLQPTVTQNRKSDNRLREWLLVGVRKIQKSVGVSRRLPSSYFALSKIIPEIIGAPYQKYCMYNLGVQGLA